MLNFFLLRQMCEALKAILDRMQHNDISTNSFFVRKVVKVNPKIKEMHSPLLTHGRIVLINLIVKLNHGLWFLLFMTQIVLQCAISIIPFLYNVLCFVIEWRKKREEFKRKNLPKIANLWSQLRTQLKWCEVILKIDFESQALLQSLWKFRICLP